MTNLGPRRPRLQVKEVTPSAARALCESWGDDRRILESERDGIVQTAHSSGLSRSEISRLTGLARTTIDRILDDGTGQAELA